MIYVQVKLFTISREFLLHQGKKIVFPVQVYYTNFHDSHGETKKKKKKVCSWKFSTHTSWVHGARCVSKDFHVHIPKSDIKSSRQTPLKALMKIHQRQRQTKWFTWLSNACCRIKFTFSTRVVHTLNCKKCLQFSETLNLNSKRQRLSEIGRRHVQMCAMYMM